MEVFIYVRQGTTHVLFSVNSGKAGVICSLRWTVSFQWEVLQLHANTAQHKRVLWLLFFVLFFVCFISSGEVSVISSLRWIIAFQWKVLNFLQPQHSVSVFFCKQRGSWRSFFFTLIRIVSVESVQLHATTAHITSVFFL